MAGSDRAFFCGRTSLSFAAVSFCGSELDAVRGYRDSDDSNCVGALQRIAKRSIMFWVTWRPLSSQLI